MWTLTKGDQTAITDDKAVKDAFIRHGFAVKPQEKPRPKKDKAED